MNETAPDIDALRAAFLSPDAHRQAGPDHPAAIALWAAAAGELPAAERDALLDHAGACGACAEAWRLILEVDRQRRGVHVTVADSRPRPRRVWRFVAGAALAGAAAVALFAILPRRGADTAPAFRDGPIPPITSLVPDGAHLPREAFVLRWSAGPAGARYTLQVDTATLETFYAVRDLDETDARVPAARFEGLPRGAKLFWRVEARNGSRTVAHSSTYQVYVE